jgi:hypothetical protein
LRGLGLISLYGGELRPISRFGESSQIWLAVVQPCRKYGLSRCGWQGKLETFGLWWNVLIQHLQDTSNLAKSPPGLVEETYDLNPKPGVSRKGFCLQKILFVFVLFISLMHFLQKDSFLHVRVALVQSYLLIFFYSFIRSLIVIKKAIKAKKKNPSRTVIPQYMILGVSVYLTLLGLGDE